jgi:hypothetical protein
MRAGLVAVLAATLLLPAAPAVARPAASDRAVVLARWTQPTAASYRLWDDARQHPERWAGYGFIWTSDLCTDGPDRPAGFDFRMPCRRHDFGYRNYRAAGTFAANRRRLDRAFYGDLRRRCGTYRPVLRPLCLGLAWTYFQATRRFGAARL